MQLHYIKRYGYIFIAITAIVVFFHPLFFSSKTFYFRDIHRFFFPMKYFLASSFKNGSTPFWCANIYCGMPYISDIQAGVFYPMSLVFLLFPFPWSFNIYVILHFFLSFCFFYLFIKAIGLSEKSGLLAAISYCFGGYTIASISTLNNLSTLVWLPAILWSFHKAAANGLRSKYFLTVFFLCMAILGGEPQLFIMITGILFFWGMTISYGNASRRYSILKNTCLIIMLIFSAVLITLVQLGPTYFDYHNSIRVGGITYAEATAFSLNVGMLKHLVLPLSFPAKFATDPGVFKNMFPGNGIPWLLTIYPGFIIVPVTVLGLFLKPSKKVFLWLAVFLVSLILALGHNTPIYYLFYKTFPFFRYPGKFMFPACFSLSIMAAYAFDALIAVLKERGIRTGRMFFLLIILLAVDLFAVHRNLNPYCDIEFYQQQHPDIQPILSDRGYFRIYSDFETAIAPGSQNTIQNTHILWQMMLMPNLGLLNNLSHINGETGLELGYQYLITEMLMKPWQEKIHFLRMANVKYVISPQALDKKPGMKGRIEKVNSMVYKILSPLPRAWIVGQLKAIEKGNIEEMIERTFEPATTALTRGEIVERYQTPFFGNVDKIDYRDNGLISLDVTSDKSGVLFISESSYPGWRVFVDGQERKRLHLNFLFQGVEIDRGKHRIDFKFRPKHFSFFLVISLGSLVLFFILWSRTFLSGIKKNEH